VEGRGTPGKEREEGREENGGRRCERGKLCGTVVTRPTTMATDKSHQRGIKDEEAVAPESPSHL
jgi:hypothetical protein